MRTSTRLLAASAVLALLAAACTRYYSGDIAGYIKDSAGSGGINGAVVRIYLSEPESADAPGFIVETASMTSGGNPGYFSHKIIWETATPTFGEEGDSGSVWLSVMHEDFIPAVREVSGILSGTLNVVPDMLLDTVAFVAPRVRGSVILNGQATNGVRMVLQIPAEEEGEDPDEYVAITQTVDEQEGTYEFTDISWRDQEPDGEEQDTQEALLFVEDNDYVSDYSDQAPFALTLTSDEPLDIETDITVSQVTYAAPVVAGRIRNINGDGVNGVQVILDIISTDDAEDYVVTTGTWDDEPGTYRFVNVSWRDEDPDTPDSDLEAVSIWVDDPDYTGSYDVDTPLPATISSEQDTEIPTDVIVTRKPRTDFSADVTGRLLYRIGGATDYADFPIQGVTVTVAYTDDEGPQQLITTTNGAGQYSFLIQWTDAAPTDDPEGEDTITITLDYSEEAPAQEYEFYDGTPDPYEVRSWLTPNYLPDGIDSDPFS